MSRSGQNVNLNLFPAPHELSNQIQQLEFVASASSQNENANSLSQFISDAASSHRINGTINVNQSNGIVIGPSIQFQAPVTFHQYINATVEGEAPPPKRIICYGQNISNLILLSIVISIILGFGIYYLALTHSEFKSNPETQFIEPKSSGSNLDGEIPDLGNGHLVFGRKHWGAVNITRTISRLKHPIVFIMITHVGVQTEPCQNLAKCVVAMRSYQDNSIASRGLADVPANFYIGGDGKIFAGRSWNHTNVYDQISLAICLMGDFNRFHPNEQHYQAIFYLIDYGISMEYIHKDYRIIAHRQTKDTQSPGEYVYRDIRTWNHYDTCNNKNEINYCGKNLGYTLDDWKSHEL